MTFRMVLATVVAFTLAATAALAASNNEPKIGFVDIDRVMSDAPRMKQHKEDLEASKQVVAAKMFLRSRNVMLSESEITELIDLRTKTGPTSADNARVKALTDLDRSRDDELKTLESTKSLTEAQKTRMKELQDIRRNSKTSGETAAKDYYDQLDGKTRDLWTKAESEVQSAVNAVAKDKRLTMVLANKIVLSNGEIVNSVLFGGIDVTDDVIGKMERKGR